MGTQQIIHIAHDSSNETDSHSDSLTYQHKDGIVELPMTSIKCLETASYLNDNVIQFYLAYLLNECCDEPIRQRVHIFDSMFFQHLISIFDNSVQKIKWKQLPKWCDVDIFKKDFLIFPICLEHHWFCIIVCYPAAVKAVDFDVTDSSDSSRIHPQSDDSDKTARKTPAILVMDSLGVKNRLATMKIRDYLDYEWRSRRRRVKRFSHHDLDDYFPKLPKQKNDYDCGVYMLLYIRCFLEQPDNFHKLALQIDDLESRKQLKSIVAKRLAQSSRTFLKQMILKIARTPIIHN